MHQIATREQLDLANRFKQVYSTYQQNRDLITVGAYRRGTDPRVDLAVEQWPKMLEFLRQDMYEPVGIERSYADLKQLVTQFSAPAAGNGPIVALLMMKSKRFEPIQEIASNSAEDLSRAMARGRRARSRTSSASSSSCKSYRDEYVRNSTQSSGAMDAVKLQNYRSFLDRLGEAMRQHTKNPRGCPRGVRKAPRAVEREAHRGGSLEPRGGPVSQGRTARRGSARTARRR